MAEHEALERSHADVVKNVSELNTWRKVKADPMLDRHQAVLIDGTDGSPALVAHIASTNTKLDYNNERLKDLVWLGRAMFYLMLSIGPILALIEGCAPVWRQKMGLPVTTSIPPAHSQVVRPPQLAGGSINPDQKVR